jgi:hypothetical protein
MSPASKREPRARETRERCWTLLAVAQDEIARRDVLPAETATEFQNTTVAALQKEINHRDELPAERPFDRTVDADCVAPVARWCVQDRLAAMSSARRSASGVAAIYDSGNFPWPTRGRSL